MLALTLAAVLLPAAVLGCSHDPHVERRAVNAARSSHGLVKRVDRTTEAGEAQILDPTQECTAYSFPIADTLLPTYPEIWKTADLSKPGIAASDKELFASINSSIPDIAPRGTRAGDFSSVSYTDADPDCWWSWNKCTSPKLKGLQKDVTRCNEPNTWGYTLDDGPNCSHNAFFDYLQQQEQKATLFYIGSNVLDWPLEAQRGLADGHEICSHTWSHPYMTSMTNEQAFAELYFSKKAIHDILGITVRCWRPPYGDVDDRIRYIAQQLDMRTVVWADDTDDWQWTEVGVAAVDKNYEAIFAKQKAGKYNKAGTIVLSHEIDGTTMQISENYLPTINQLFTGGVMPVAVCMNNTTPYLETDKYVYPDYAQWASGTRSVSLAAPTAVSATGVEVSFAASSTTSAAGSSKTTAASAVSTGASSSAQAQQQAAAQSSAAATSQKATSGAIGGAVVSLAAVLGAVVLGAVAVV
ncbi:hypothetical protein JCM10207_007317 [Rhodosporidiobolus poonsookiae]